MSDQEYHPFSPRIIRNAIVYSELPTPKAIKTAYVAQLPGRGTVCGLQVHFDLKKCLSALSVKGKLHSAALMSMRGILEGLFCSDVTVLEIGENEAGTELIALLRCQVTRQ